MASAQLAWSLHVLLVASLDAPAALLVRELHRRLVRSAERVVLGDTEHRVGVGQRLAAREVDGGDERPLLSNEDVNAYAASLDLHLIEDREVVDPTFELADLGVRERGRRRVREQIEQGDGARLRDPFEVDPFDHRGRGARDLGVKREGEDDRAGHA